MFIGVVIIIGVLRREDGHILIGALDFEIEGQMRLDRTWKIQVGKKV